MQRQAFLVEGGGSRMHALLRQYQRQAGEREPQPTTLDALAVSKGALSGQALLQQGSGAGILAASPGLHRRIDQQLHRSLVRSHHTAQRGALGEPR
jgi:hypothetical protein